LVFSIAECARHPRMSRLGCSGTATGALPGAARRPRPTPSAPSPSAGPHFKFAICDRKGMIVHYERLATPAPPCRSSRPPRAPRGVRAPRALRCSLLDSPCTFTAPTIEVRLLPPTQPRVSVAAVRFPRAAVGLPARVVGLAVERRPDLQELRYLLLVPPGAGVDPESSIGIYPARPFIEKQERPSNHKVRRAFLVLTIASLAQ